MSTKDKIMQLVDSIPPEKQESLLGIVENFVSAQYDFEDEFEEMPEEWKQRLEKSMKEAEEGKLIPFDEFMVKFRNRYGLND